MERKLFEVHHSMLDADCKAPEWMEEYILRASEEFSDDVRIANEAYAAEVRRILSNPKLRPEYVATALENAKGRVPRCGFYKHVQSPEGEGEILVDCLMRTLHFDLI